MKTNSLYGVSAVTFEETKVFEDRSKGVPYRLFYSSVILSALQSQPACPPAGALPNAGFRR